MAVKIDDLWRPRAAAVEGERADLRNDCQDSTGPRDCSLRRRRPRSPTEQDSRSGADGAAADDSVVNDDQGPP